MPTARRMLSGVASALFIARRIQPGLAANRIPSSTNRMPTPMRKSANAMDLIGLKLPARSCFCFWQRAKLYWLRPYVVALRPRRRGHGRRGDRRLAGGVAEELEEVRIRPQQEAGIVALQPVLIGRHRAVEREEIRVLAISLGEQPVAFAVARAAHLLSGRIGFGDDDGSFAVGLRPDLLRLLAALGAEFGGLALPLGLHALVDGLAVLFRQVGAPDPHIHNLDAVTIGFLVELVADPRHQGFALVAHHLDEG